MDKLTPAIERRVDLIKGKGIEQGDLVILNYQTIEEIGPLGKKREENKLPPKGSVAVFVKEHKDTRTYIPDQIGVVLYDAQFSLYGCIE